MEPGDIPLSPSRPGSRCSSRSSSTPSFRSAMPSPSLPASEWPFPDLCRSRSSSRASSSWPFVKTRSRSLSSYSRSPDEEDFPIWDRRYRYKPVPAKDWVGIYPPDFFDLEKIEEWIEKAMFKKDYRRGWLYDETGKVNLPVDGKGILILDPVSRTRIIDVEMEMYILSEYHSWIEQASGEAELGTKQGVDWMKGLRKAVFGEWATVSKERTFVIDQERRKRGLTDYDTYEHWRYYGHSGSDASQDVQTSNSSSLGSAVGPTESNDGHDCLDRDTEELGNDSPSPEPERSPPDLPTEPPETSSATDCDTQPPMNLSMFW